MDQRAKKEQKEQKEQERTRERIQKMARKKEEERRVKEKRDSIARNKQKEQEERDEQEEQEREAKQRHAKNKQELNATAPRKQEKVVPALVDLNFDVVEENEATVAGGGGGVATGKALQGGLVDLNFDLVETSAAASLSSLSLLAGFDIVEHVESGESVATLPTLVDGTAVAKTLRGFDLIESSGLTAPVVVKPSSSLVQFDVVEDSEKKKVVVDAQKDLKGFGFDVVENINSA
jgi:hypothetical protein